MATTSQNGWPVIWAVDRPHMIDERPINGHRYPNGFRKGNVYKAFVWLFTQLNNRVEPVAEGSPPDEWGYNVKRIGKGKIWSNHSSGTAGDYNASQHAQGRHDTYSLRQRQEIREILAEADGIFRWGADFSNPDDMHFEIIKGPEEVAAFIFKIEREQAMNEVERRTLIRELLATDLGEKGGNDTVGISLQSGLRNGQAALTRITALEKKVEELIALIKAK